jgi:hypothetical protein
MHRYYFSARKKAVTKPSKSYELFGSLLMAFLLVMVVSYGLNFLEGIISSQRGVQVKKEEVRMAAQVEPQFWPADKKLALTNLS